MVLVPECGSGPIHCISSVYLISWEEGEFRPCPRGNALLQLMPHRGLTTADGASGQAGHTARARISGKAHDIFSCDVSA